MRYYHVAIPLPIQLRHHISGSVYVDGIIEVNVCIGTTWRLGTCV
jgi:hypothetical protein